MAKNFPKQFKEEQKHRGPNPPVIPSIEFIQSLKTGNWTTRVVIRAREEYSAPSPLGDIKRINRLIVDDIGHAVFGVNFKLTEETGKQIRRLAEHGKQLLDALIPANRQDEFIRGLLEGPTMHFGAPERRRGMVVTYEQACRIWWPFIYTGELPKDADPVDLGGFLGSRVLFVADCLVQETGDGNSKADQPPSLPKTELNTERPIVRHVWDNKLLAGSLPQDALWHDGVTQIDRIELTQLDPDPAQYIPMRDRLAAFVMSSSDAIHFDCHGLPEHHEEPWIINLGVLKDFTARHDDLKVWRFQQNHFSIGVLNVCYSARGQLCDPSQSLAESFIAQGMSAVIAPMAKAPLVLLMEASKAIYGELLDGETLLSAFNFAQEKVLEDGNPAAHALILHMDKAATAVDFVLKQSPNVASGQN
jgi:hypothetical protein